MTKQFQLFKDCCPMCGKTEGTIQFQWAQTACSNDGRIFGHMKGHEILVFTCECGTKTVVERLPVITMVIAP